jgi:hypothetical protein
MLFDNLSVPLVLIATGNALATEFVLSAALLLSSRTPPLIVALPAFVAEVFAPKSFAPARIQVPAPSLTKSIFVPPVVSELLIALAPVFDPDKVSVIGRVFEFWFATIVPPKVSVAFVGLALFVIVKVPLVLDGRRIARGALIVCAFTTPLASWIVPPLLTFSSFPDVLPITYEPTVAPENVMPPISRLRSTCMGLADPPMVPEARAELNVTTSALTVFPET